VAPAAFRLSARRRTLTAIPSTSTAGTILISAAQALDTNFDYFAVRWSLQSLPPGDPGWNRITTGGVTRNGQGGYFTTTYNPIVAWPSGQPTGTRIYFYVSKVGTAGELATGPVISAVSSTPSDSGGGQITAIPAIQVDDTAPFQAGVGLEEIGNVTYGGNQARATVTPGVPTSGVRHFDQLAPITMQNGAIEFGPLTFVQRNGAGTGETTNQVWVDWGGNNVAILQRHTTYNTASQTPSSDRLECLLYKANQDVGQLLATPIPVPAFDFSSVLSGAAVWFKIALLSDNKTVSFQVAADDKQYVELVSRQYPDTSVTQNVAASLRWQTQTYSSDLVTTQGAIGPFKGTTVAATPPSSGVPALTNSALTFASPGQTRMAPLSNMGGPPVSMFFLGKIASVTRPTIPMGICRSDLVPERYIKFQPATGATTTANLLEMRGTGAIVQGSLLLPPAGTWILVACSWDAAGNWSQHIGELSGSNAGRVQHAGNFFSGTPEGTLTTGTFPGARLGDGRTDPWCYRVRDPVLRGAGFDVPV
jgi:hypothetical protein